MLQLVSNEGLEKRHLSFRVMEHENIPDFKNWFSTIVIYLFCFRMKGWLSSSMAVATCHIITRARAATKSRIITDVRWMWQTNRIHRSRIGTEKQEHVHSGQGRWRRRSSGWVTLKCKMLQLLEFLQSSLEVSGKFSKFYSVAWLQKCIEIFK